MGVPSGTRIFIYAFYIAANVLTGSLVNAEHFHHRSLIHWTIWSVLTLVLFVGIAATFRGDD